MSGAHSGRQIPGGGLTSYGGDRFAGKFDDSEDERGEDRFGGSLDSPDGREREVSPEHDDGMAWPTQLLQLSGTKGLFQEFSANDARRAGADNSATGDRAGMQRRRVDRLSASESVQLEALVKDVAFLADRSQACASDGQASVPPHHDINQEEIKRARQQLDLEDNPSRQAIFSLLTDSRMRQDVGERILRILADPDFDAKDVGWTSLLHMRREVDRLMPDFAGTHEVPLCIPGNHGQSVRLRYKDNKPVTFAYNGLWGLGIDMFREAEYASSTVLRPQPEFNDVTGAREYGTFAGGLLFQEMCRTAPPDHIVLAMMLASDEATFMSRMSAYPVYCGLPPIPVPSCTAFLLISDLWHRVIHPLRLPPADRLLFCVFAQARS